MPRPRRVHLPGALYLVSSRAEEGGVLFKDARDYRTYLELLKDAQERFAFKLFAYVLLSDELFLCLEPTNDATISTIMHAINSHYTKAFIKRYGHAEHVFQERFKATMAEKAPSLLRLIGYLHVTPARMGLVADLKEHPWSSYHAYLAAGASLFGPSLRGEVGEACAQLACERPDWTYDLSLRAVPETQWRELDLLVQERVIGSPEFRALVERQAKAAAQESAEPQPVSPTPAVMPQSAARPRASVALTGSLVVAMLSLVATGLYAKNLSTLKQTVHVLAQERMLEFMGVMRQSRTLHVGGEQFATVARPAGLAGTEWDLQLTPVTPEAGGSPKKDGLVFDQDRVASSAFASEGFGESHYTATAQPDGTLVWETMQRNASGEVARWHGEWRGATMRGVISHQANGRAPDTYTFVGVPRDAAARKEI